MCLANNNWLYACISEVNIALFLLHYIYLTVLVTLRLKILHIKHMNRQDVKLQIELLSSRLPVCRYNNGKMLLPH